VRHLRVEREIGAAGVRVDVEDFLPRLAAVGGLEDAALLVGVPGVPGRADVDRVARLRADGDAGDVLAVVEAERFPRAAAVGRLVDAAADGDGVAHPRLAGADPGGPLVRRIDGDRADPLAVLGEARLEWGAGVGRRPAPAAGRADADRRRRVRGRS